LFYSFCYEMVYLFSFDNKMITIYHNPHCSKSREAFVVLEKISIKNNLTMQVIEYLKTPPTLAELQKLQKELAIDAKSMVRDNEPEFAELGLENASDMQLLQAVAHHPRLLQRPIVTYRGRAVIGRPPEQVATLFEEG
jgi:arsenate reductase